MFSAATGFAAVAAFGAGFAEAVLVVAGLAPGLDGPGAHAPPFDTAGLMG